MSDVSGIQLDKLLFSPFKSAQETQISMSLSSLKYISDYGLDASGNLKIVQIKSTYYDMPSATTKDVSLNIPLISLINIPCLYVKNVSINFDINIQSQSIDTSEVPPSVPTSESFSKSGKSRSTIKTSGYVSSNNSKDDQPKYNMRIDAINEKPIGLLLIYDFININRDIIRTAIGTENVSLKSMFT